MCSSKNAREMQCSVCVSCQSASASYAARRFDLQKRAMQLMQLRMASCRALDLAFEFADFVLGSVLKYRPG